MEERENNLELRLRLIGEGNIGENGREGVPGEVICKFGHSSSSSTAAHIGQALVEIMGSSSDSRSNRSSSGSIGRIDGRSIMGRETARVISIAISHPPTHPPDCIK